MEFSSDIVVKILLAILAGGLIGAEREFRDKAAGFRTMIFICLGSTLFTIFSLELGGEEDSTRIASNIVSGIGFLGAGVIMRHTTGEVRGLTTAATIWLVAALGMGIGGGYYAIVSIAVGATLIVLFIFPTLEAFIDNVRDARVYEIVSVIEPGIIEEIEKMFVESGLRARLYKQAKNDGNMICIWYVHGSPKKQALLTDKLFAHPSIKEFRY